MVECRGILGGNSPESDADLEFLRNGLYELARAVVEAFSHQFRENGHDRAPDAPQRTIAGEPKVLSASKSASFLEALQAVPEEDRYELEERAGIMEFDGGLDRDAAERATFTAYWRGRHAGN